MSALFAAMKGHIALGASTLEVYTSRQGGRAVVTPRRSYRLDQARKAGARNVYRWARTLVARAVIAIVAVHRWTLGILVATLSVFAVAIHGSG